MNKQQVLEWKARWQAVNAFEREERRAASIEDRWLQLNGIVGLLYGLDRLPGHSEAELAAVRQRWNLLKNIYS